MMDFVFLLPMFLFQVISLDTGEALGPNQQGEVCLKGRQTMLGN